MASQRTHAVLHGIGTRGDACSFQTTYTHLLTLPAVHMRMLCNPHLLTDLKGSPHIVAVTHLLESCAHSAAPDDCKGLHA